MKTLFDFLRNFNFIPWYFRRRAERKEIYENIVQTCYGFKVELPTRYEYSRSAFRYNNDAPGMMRLERRVWTYYKGLANLTTHKYKFVKSGSKWVEYKAERYPDSYKWGDSEFFAFEALLETSSKPDQKNFGDEE